MRIAVLGSGISGMAAAYYLSRSHEVTLLEKEPRLGGHTYTVDVNSSRGPLPIDMGFIVHNRRTYPNLIRLFDELGVETAPSDMSFGVSHRRTGFEYSSRGLNGFFANRANLFRPDQYLLLKEILRFNREAPTLLDNPTTAHWTLGDFIERHHYSARFTDRYLYPMTAAVWSMSTDAVRGFPLLPLIRFFENHGMLGLDTHPQWRVVRGGSRSYIAPLTEPYRARIQTGITVRSISRTAHEVAVHFDDRPSQRFDQLVFACHAPQVLPLLEAPTEAERDVLSHFQTNANQVTLHTDENLLPRRAAARASWNYLLGDAPQAPVTLTYLMNRLQNLDTPEQYAVTLNSDRRIHPAHLVHQRLFHHPLYHSRAIHAQSRWSEISGHNRTHFCGAYWFYGFHEDGLNSALRVARSLGVDC